MDHVPIVNSTHEVKFFSRFGKVDNPGIPKVFFIRDSKDIEQLKALPDLPYQTTASKKPNALIQTGELKPNIDAEQAKMSVTLSQPSSVAKIISYPGVADAQDVYPEVIRGLVVEDISRQMFLKHLSTDQLKLSSPPLAKDLKTFAVNNLKSVYFSLAHFVTFNFKYLLGIEDITIDLLGSKIDLKDVGFSHSKRVRLLNYDVQVDVREHRPLGPGNTFDLLLCDSVTLTVPMDRRLTENYVHGNGISHFAYIKNVYSDIAVNLNDVPILANHRGRYPRRYPFRADGTTDCHVYSYEYERPLKESIFFHGQKLKLGLYDKNLLGVYFAKGIHALDLSWDSDPVFSPDELRTVLTIFSPKHLHSLSLRNLEKTIDVCSTGEIVDANILGNIVNLTLSYQVFLSLIDSLQESNYFSRVETLTLDLRDKVDNVDIVNLILNSEGKIPCKNIRIINNTHVEKLDPSNFSGQGMCQLEKFEIERIAECDCEYLSTKKNGV